MFVLVLIQKLQLAFGSTTSTMALCLAILLGGLGLGGWWSPRLRSGLLYGGAAVGAALGCVIAGFYTLRLYDQTTTLVAAAAIGLIVAGVAKWLPTRPDQAESAEAEEFEPDFDRRTILWTTALAGAASLGASIVWTRLLGMLMGSTTYVFTIIITALPLGVGLGAVAGAWIGRRATPRLALGGCHILMPIAMAWTCYTISDSMPYWPVNPFLASSPLFTFQIDMARVLWAVLPSALLWGASFALALAAAGSSSAVYVANAAGAVVSVLGISLLVVPAMGTQMAQRIAILLAAAGALTTLGPYVRRYNANALGAALSGSLMLAIWLATQVNAVPGEFIAYGRQMSTMLGQSQIVYTAEGVNSSVAISTWAANQVYLNVNGHVQATTELYDLALQRMIAHLPGILHPNPKSVLGIGFGAGVSSGSFTRYPSIEHITIVEAEPVIPPASSKYFAKQNYDVAMNPKAKIVFDDARHFMFTTNDKFDIIATDPMDVFAKGTAAMYSKEYFEAVKEHLNPGGFVTLYVPLYETDERTVQGELATFFNVFPNASVWANTREGAGYDMVVLGQADPLKIDIDEVQARLNRDDYGPVRESLMEIGISNPAALFKKYTGRQRDLGRWFADTEITTDGNLRLMYTAGWAINSYMADSIYRQMLRYRQVPRDMFAGDPDTIEDILAVSSGVARTPATPGTTLLPAPTSSAGQPPR